MSADVCDADDSGWEAFCERGKFSMVIISAAIIRKVKPDFPHASSALIYAEGSNQGKAIAFPTLSNLREFIVEMRPRSVEVFGADTEDKFNMDSVLDENSI